MLVLSRKHNETLHIGNDIVITIVRVRGDSVRIGIQAPKEIHVMRSELIGTPPKQPVAPDATVAPATAKRPSHGPRASRLASDQAPQDGQTESKECGPLAPFLKIFPKAELSTAT